MPPHLLGLLNPRTAAVMIWSQSATVKLSDYDSRWTLVPLRRGLLSGSGPYAVVNPDPFGSLCSLRTKAVVHQRVREPFGMLRTVSPVERFLC